MKLDSFLSAREPDWRSLEEALGKAKGRPDRLGAQGVLRLGRLYRGAAADLALARRAFPGDPVVRRLEVLVRQARITVYADVPSERETIRGFFATGYWRRVRERPTPLAVAALLLFLPMALAVAWGIDDPGAAIGVVPEAFRGETASTGNHDIGLEDRSAFATAIFTNNLQVSFLAFAGGLLAGLGTAVVLLYNGLGIGALVGLAIDEGKGPLVAELITPTACWSSPASWSRRPPDCAWDGPWWCPETGPAPRPWPPRRAARSRSCSAPSHGWCSRAWWRAS